MEKQNYPDHVVLRKGEEYVENIFYRGYWEPDIYNSSDVRNHPFPEEITEKLATEKNAEKKLAKKPSFLKFLMIAVTAAILFFALFSSSIFGKKIDDGFSNLRKASLSESSVNAMKKASEEAIEESHVNEMYCEGNSYTKMYPHATRYKVSSIEFQYGYVSALVDPSQYSYNTPDNYAVLIYKVELAGVNRKEGITETVYSPVCFQNIKTNSNGRLLNRTESEFYISNGEFSDSLAVDTGGFLTPEEAEEHVSESGYEKVSEIK